MGQFDFRRPSTFNDWYGNVGGYNPFQDVVFGNDDDEEEDNSLLGDAEQYLNYTDPASSPYLRRMNEVMAQKQPAMEQYLSNMATMPQRADYNPSKWTRIAAALAGFGTGIKEGGAEGIKVGEAVRMLPWREAYDDWASRNESYGASAKMEQEKLKQILDDLQRMEDARVKQENANTAKAGARARLSTAGTYKKMVEQPSLDVYSDADSTFLYDRKGGRATTKLGKSAAAAQREFQGKEGAANRANALNITNLNNEGAMARTIFNGFNSSLNRTKTTRVIPQADKKMAQNDALAEIISDPMLAREYGEFIAPDENMNKAYKDKGLTFLKIVPPAAANVAAMAKFKKFKQLYDERTNAQFLRVPTSTR